MEKTLVIIKPDAVNRDLVGKIISRFEKKGLKIAGLKMEKLKQEKLSEHYAHHKGKPFFKSLIKFMSSIPAVVVCLEGKEAVRVVRQIVGSTNSREAAPGTIRGDYSMSLQQNVIHASESPEIAKQEIKRFFEKNQLHEYKTLNYEMVYGEDERE